VRIPVVLAELGKTLLAAMAATGAGLVCAAGFGHPLAALAAGSLAVGAVFLLLLWALNVQAFLPAVRIATRKLRNVS
jgi:putative peptidoglycan lipid II flippase